MNPVTNRVKQRHSVSERADRTKPDSDHIDRTYLGRDHKSI